MNYKIVIATTNKDKIKEMSEILNSLDGLRVEIESLQNYNIAESYEPFDSFMLNAIHKAKYYAKHTKQPSLTEDSGLSIEALEGFPGVKSKDLIEECGGISNTFMKLEQMLSGTNNYTAYFSSAIVLYIPSHDFLITHEEKGYGTLSFPPRGEFGFAFDHIFIPDGYDKTFSELGIEIKNKISPRAKAMKELIQKLQEFLN